MTEQTLFNIAVSLAGGLGGWWLRVIWTAVHELSAADGALGNRISSIEVLVSGSYVRRDELRHVLDGMSAKLDRISDKLERKADRA